MERKEINVGGLKKNKKITDGYQDNEIIMGCINLHLV